MVVNKDELEESGYFGQLWNRNREALVRLSDVERDAAIDEAKRHGTELLDAISKKIPSDLPLGEYANANARIVLTTPPLVQEYVLAHILDQQQSWIPKAAGLGELTTEYNKRLSTFPAKEQNAIRHETELLIAEALMSCHLSDSELGYISDGGLATFVGTHILNQIQLHPDIPIMEQLLQSQRLSKAINAPPKPQTPPITSNYGGGHSSSNRSSSGNDHKTTELIAAGVAVAGAIGTGIAGWRNRVNKEKPDSTRTALKAVSVALGALAAGLAAHAFLGKGRSK